MSRVAQVRVADPWVSRPLLFQPDYVTAAACALAFARPLTGGFMAYGELEDRLLPYLAGPDWQRELRAREEASVFIAQAVAVYEAGRHA